MCSWYGTRLLGEAASPAVDDCAPGGRSSGSDEAQVASAADGLCACVDAQLAVDRLHVGANRVHREVQRGGDLRGVETARQVTQHGELALAQRIHHVALIDATWWWRDRTGDGR